MNRNQISPTTLNSDLRELSQIQLLPGQIYQGEGFAPFAYFPRLLEELNLEPGDENQLGLYWQVNTWMDQPIDLAAEYRLRISLRGTLPLQCQHCLGKLEEVIDFETQFLILPTEEEVEAYPLDDDLEDVLAADPKFNLFDLLEGEALLSIPLMPQHELGLCIKNDELNDKSIQNQSKSSKSEDFDESEKRPNPFEVLKKLKLDK